jgi:hypothetical protein
MPLKDASAAGASAAGASAAGASATEPSSGQMLIRLLCDKLRELANVIRKFSLSESTQKELDDDPTAAACIACGSSFTIWDPPYRMAVDGCVCTLASLMCKTCLERNISSCLPMTKCPQCSKPFNSPRMIIKDVAYTARLEDMFRLVNVHCSVCKKIAKVSQCEAHAAKCTFLQKMCVRNAIVKCTPDGMRTHLEDTPCDACTTETLRILGKLTLEPITSNNMTLTHLVDTYKVTTAHNEETINNLENQVYVYETQLNELQPAPDGLQVGQELTHVEVRDQVSAFPVLEHAEPRFFYQGREIVASAPVARDNDDSNPRPHTRQRTR